MYSQKGTEVKRRSVMNGNKNCTELSIFKKIVGIFLFGLAAVLGNVIRALKAKGYRFGTLDELTGE